MLRNADAAFAEKLSNAVPDLSVRPAEPAYLEEPRGLYKGQDGFVARPVSTDQVAAVVRMCGTEGIGIIPYGGGTGLVAGQIAADGPVPLILSLEKMSAIRATYPDESALVVEAGATLGDIHRAADALGLLFPLTYASKESARIGGALAVNSGGLNVLRYGMARSQCLGLEAVMADGQIFHGLKRLRKDNTGYDLRNLLIGSEGTLGIITAAALALSPRPAHVSTAFLAVTSPKAALELLRLMRDRAGETISAFELISRQGFEFLDETGMETRHPFETIPTWSVLTEIGTGPGTDPEAMLLHVFEEAMEHGLVTDGAIAQSGQQRDDFWAMRETIPAANRRVGAIASHDISLPLSEIPDFLDEAAPRIRAIAPVRVSAFGHLGDGNLHYNMFPPKGESPDAYRHHAAAFSEVVHDFVVARGGSFSAEHGIGRMKAASLERYGDPAKLSAMRAIKAALDPKGILNPGAVLATG
ncbi:MAG: FAD-binding oxidoreductase [Silicimonas sp.]|nr:FAD-binding oxidoreductase [Silicimonas sp.]